MEMLKGVQVLVIDNDRSSGEMYETLLNPFDATVTYSGSVKSALKIIDCLIPDIIVCEIRFLGESIYKLIDKLSVMEGSNGNHIPIIVTSTCVTGSHEQIPDVEFESYLLKPSDPEKLVSTIANLMQVRSDTAIPSRLACTS